MKKTIENIASLPKWYGFVAISMYAILFAEYMNTINIIYISNKAELSGFISTIMNINYVIIFLSCIAVWIISSLLFHLTAVLFNGNIKFSKFLFTALYPFIIPSIAIFIAILLLKNNDITKDIDMEQFLIQSSHFRMVTNIVNYSFIPYYLLIIYLIRYLYNFKWLYAFFSVAIPSLTIWGISELFNLL